MLIAIIILSIYSVIVTLALVRFLQVHKNLPKELAELAHTRKEVGQQMEKTTAAMAEFNNKADSITTEKQQFNDMLDGNTKVMLQTLRTRLQTNPEEGMKAISRAFKEILGEELAN